MTLSSMPKAMILAAGLGTRMRPVTDHMPKPMVPVAGIPLIDRALDWLDASGVQEVVINSHYRAAQLEEHLAARQAPKVHLSREDIVLETGGGIKKALPILGSSAFFVVNSDTICLDGATPALHRLLQHWDDEAMDALLLVHPLEQAIGFDGKGDFFVSSSGVVRRRGTEDTAPFVFTGIQLMHPRLFRPSPDGAFSLNVLYNRGMLDDGTLPRIRALAHDGHWLHIGDPKGLRDAEAFLAQYHPSSASLAI
jgi:N-acetyl-alpha-D-muramate 1-phosphate uridylyltransferase